MNRKSYWTIAIVEIFILVVFLSYLQLKHNNLSYFVMELLTIASIVYFGYSSDKRENDKIKREMESDKRYKERIVGLSGRLGIYLSEIVIHKIFTDDKYVENMIESCLSVMNTLGIKIDALRVIDDLVSYMKINSGYLESPQKIISRNIQELHGVIPQKSFDIMFFIANYHIYYIISKYNHKENKFVFLKMMNSYIINKESVESAMVEIGINVKLPEYDSDLKPIDEAYRKTVSEFDKRFRMPDYS
ncbi:MAG: hypothetical protein V2A56_11715 [bacterium]